MEVKPKPPHGSPCNNCGLCCIDQLCPLAVHIFGPQPGPCLALESVSTGKVCGMVTNPIRYALEQVFTHGNAAVTAAAARLVGAGAGCDAIAVGEPADERFRQRMRADALRNPATKEMKIMGIKQ